MNDNRFIRLGVNIELGRLRLHVEEGIEKWTYENRSEMPVQNAFTTSKKTTLARARNAVDRETGM